MTKRSMALVGLGCAVALSACAAVEEGKVPATPDLQARSQALTEEVCDELVINPDRSLAVHDAETLQNAGDGGDFSLANTLKAIIASSGGSATTPEELLGSMLDSFGLREHTNPTSGLAMPLDVRPAERDLDPAQLLNQNSVNFLRPVALFNRLDLAPASGVTCGEHRIVYAKTNTSGGRLLLIFEAALPNPTPEKGIAGCKPVADFWAKLSTAEFQAASLRHAELKKFYYQGLAGFAPVVQHANFGVPFGQVRSNHFMQFRKWQLREWRTSFDVPGRATFVVDTTKQTPLAELYDSGFNPPASSPLDAVLFAAERTAFQNDFVSNQIDRLTAPELSGATLSPADVVNGFGSAFPPRFDDVQSDAQLDPSSSDDPAARAASGFSAKLATATKGGLTPRQLLNRAGAMSCGGCHSYSVNKDIGTLNGATVRWPASVDFVHVSESGELSPALRDFFLPARARILEQFACSEAPPSNCGGYGGAACGPVVVRPILPILRPIPISPISPIDPPRPPTVVLTPRPVAVRSPVLSEANVIRLRQAEQALPGAFVPVRRSH